MIGSNKVLDAHIEKAESYSLKGDHRRAELAFNKIVQDFPDESLAWLAKGNWAKSLNRFHIAFPFFEKAYQLDSKRSDVLLAYAQALIQKKDFTPALDIYQKILNQYPDHLSTLNLMGLALMAIGEIDDALRHFEHALKCDPHNDATYNNLGGLARYKGEYDKATKMFEQSYYRNPSNSGYQTNLAFHYLLLGRYEEAWPFYRGNPDAWNKLYALRAFNAPMWKGENLRGKKILIVPDQGFGDSLQMARFLNILSQKGALVSYEVRPQLRALFETLEEDIKLPKAEDKHIQYDYFSLFFNLPAQLNVTLDSIPSSDGYLKAPKDRMIKWQEKLTQARRKHRKKFPTHAIAIHRIGIVWAGNPNHSNDLERSLTLDHLTPLFDIPSIEWVCLQVGPTKTAIKDHPHYTKMIDLMDDVKDFADTAAIINQLDHVITTDTSVAHLCGALGFPAWVMVAQPFDWRWLLYQEDSPWYKSLRIFYQESAFQWEHVVAKIEKALIIWLENEVKANHLKG